MESQRIVSMACEPTSYYLDMYVWNPFLVATYICQLLFCCCASASTVPAWIKMGDLVFLCTVRITWQRHGKLLGQISNGDEHVNRTFTANLGSTRVQGHVRLIRPAAPELSVIERRSVGTRVMPTGPNTLPAWADVCRNPILGPLRRLPLHARGLKH